MSVQSLRVFYNSKIIPQKLFRAKVIKKINIPMSGCHPR